MEEILEEFKHSERTIYDLKHQLNNNVSQVITIELYR